jgi:predicted nucleotidyltransferase
MMPTKPTPYTDINALLECFLAELRAILGEKLIGLYLFGSLVTGDFDPSCSDIDLLAAVTSDIDEREFAALDEMHQRLIRDYRYWEGRIEIAYLSEHALKTFRTERSQIGIMSPGEPFHLKDAGKDWLINWYVVREKGVTLSGPPPASIIHPIAKEEYLQGVRDYALLLKEWIHGDTQARPGQAYAVLAMSRALYALKNGEIASKKKAAEWAEREFPEWATLIRQALSWREAWRDENVDHAATLPETRRFVSFMLDQIDTDGTSASEA